MTMQSLTTKNGYEAVCRDGIVIAVLNDGQPVSMREEGLATVALMEAVETLCAARGWPDWAVIEIINGCMHGRNMGLYGQILPWDEVKDQF